MDLAELLAHIDRDLAGDVALVELARHAGMSPFHFHRTFRAAVGEAPHAYVRRLRLERAALRLKLSTRSVTDIAFGVGYATHEGFTRAFTAHFGVAPQSYRAALPAPALPVGSAPRIVRLPPRRLAVVPHVGPYDRAAGAFERLATWAAARRVLGSSMLGFHRDDQDITAAERMRCEVALAVPSTITVASDVAVRDLPGGDYAVVEHQGDVAERRRLYEALVRRWLPSIGRQPSGATPYEEYAVVGQGVDRARCRIHILLRPR